MAIVNYTNMFSPKVKEKVLIIISHIVRKKAGWTKIKIKRYTKS